MHLAVPRVLHGNQGKGTTIMSRKYIMAIGAVIAFTLLPVSFAAATGSCSKLPKWFELRQALCQATMGDVTCASNPAHGGFSLHMWATVVDRDGVVCAVAFTGADRGDQWPGSRVISAQKANTANAFGLPGLSISTAQLWQATRDQGSLADLVESNPVDPAVAYRGSSNRYGKKQDPMVGRKIGGVNIFGGGLALYKGGKIIGAIGVSGDTSCEDHSVAWNARAHLGLDAVPAGPATVFAVAGAVLGDEMIMLDAADTAGFGHQRCFNDDAGSGTLY